MRNFLTIVTAAVLVGCASSSGVVPTGEGTYMISRSEKGLDTTGAQVKADTLKEANQYCASLGKTIELIETEKKDMVPFTSDAQATIEFRCVSNE